MSKEDFKFTVPVTTAIGSDGNVDKGAYEDGIRWCVETNGVGSVLIDGTTGCWHMAASQEDRRRRHEIGVRMVKELGGYATVNIAADTVEESLDYATRAADHGADRVVAMLPRDPERMSDEEMFEFSRRISEGVPSAVEYGFYEFKDLIGKSFISILDQILGLDRRPSVLKWTSGDVFASLCIAEFYKADDFVVAPAHELAIEEAIQFGVGELVSGAFAGYPILAPFIETIAQAEVLDLRALSECQRLAAKLLREFRRLHFQYANDMNWGAFGVIKAAVAAQLDGYPLAFPEHAGIDSNVVDHLRDVVFPKFKSELAAIPIA